MTVAQYTSPQLFIPLHSLVLILTTKLDTALGTVKELGEEKVEKLEELASNNSDELTFLDMENLFPLQEEAMGTNSIPPYPEGYGHKEGSEKKKMNEILSNP